MVKGKNAIKIILMTILSFVGLLFFTYNNLSANESAGCFSFQDNKERLITTKGSGWGEGFKTDCGEYQTLYIIEFLVKIDNKNKQLTPEPFTNDDDNGITRVQNYMKEQIINSEPGYYKVTYKITYKLDGLEKTETLIKEITVLDPGLSDNNNIFDTSIVWGGDLLGSKSGRLNASTPYLERNEDGEYIGMGKTIVVGNINSDNQSYIAVVDNYGKFYGNAFLYNFGRDVDNPDDYPTVINAIEYSGRENAENSIYWIIGRYQEASKWKPFMSRVIWNDETSSFELYNNEEWGDYVPSGYDSGEFLSMIVHVKKDIDENYSTYPVVTGYFQNASMQRHGAILKFKDELGPGILQFQPVIPEDFNVNSNFEFRSIIWTNEEQTRFAVVGYRTNVTASSDSAGILREYKIDETGNLVLQAGNSFDKFLHRRDDVPYRTQFNDVIKDGDRYIIVGSTTYSDGNAVIHSGGSSDGLILIVNYVNPDGAGQRIITYGTGADGEKLNSISLTNDTRADGFDYVAVGKRGNKGFIIEIKKEITTGSITLLGAGTNYSARAITTKNAGTGSELHNLYLSNNSEEERSDYFVLGSFTAADYIEGLGTTSGGFLFLNYQNGGFKKPVSVIEVNYGYDDPGNEPLTDEDIIRQIIGDNLSLRYDGVFQHDYSGENSIRILETGSYTNVYTFAYFNNSKTGVYIPITIKVVNLAAAPQVSSSTVSGFIDSFAIPMYYTYKRVVNQPTDPGTTKVDPGTGVHDLYNYKPLFSYEFERNLHPVGSLYYKDDKGEFISIEPENEKNIRKVKYSIIEEEISPGTVCFNKDDFGDYIKSSTDCKTGISYSASDSEARRNNHTSTVENNPPLVYLNNNQHYNVYSREEVYERVSLENMEETEMYYYRNASDKYWITETKPYDTYNEYYRKATTTERAKQQLTANFNTKESAHQFALFQEMLRVRKVPVNQITLGEGNNFTINGFSATVNYYPGELTKIRDGNRHIVENVYVYYIDLGSVSPSVPKTCAADTSCTNYGGYAFSSLAEVEKAAKEFISGKKSIPFIRYTERTSPSQYSSSVLQEANNHFYKDEVNTFAYYQSLNFPMTSGSRNLTLKVWEKLSAKQVKEMNFSGAKVFHRETREEYIELETSFEKNTLSFGKNGDLKSEGLYTVQYCYAYTKNCGEPKSFYLDYSAPVLGYSFANKVKKEFLVINDIEYIKNKITINSTNVSDNHDEYMVITGRNNVYKEQINETFEYQGEDKICTITVSDRAGNTHTYNFIIGGIAPTVQINNKTLKSFEVDITVGNEEEVRNSIIENGISVYFTPFGSQRIRDTELEAFINRMITDMDEESISVQLSMSLNEIDEGNPIQVGDEEEDNILTYIPQMGYYEFRITDIFGNSPYRDAGLGLRDLELDFYEEGDFSDDNERDVKVISYNFKENEHTYFKTNTDYYIKIDKGTGDDYFALYGAKYVVRDHYVFSDYVQVQVSEIGKNKKSVIEYYLLNEGEEYVKDNSDDPISGEHFIKKYVPVDLSSVGELKDGNEEYAFKVYDNEVGTYFVVDTVIKVHHNVNVVLYLVSEINTEIDGLIEYSSLPRFDASGYDIELPPEVDNIDYYINNEDSYVRFSFDKYTYIRINQYSQDEYGFIGNSNVCQFKIVGSEYNQDIEDPEERGSICNEDMVFKFLVFENFDDFYADFNDKQTVWDEETRKRTYAIVKHEENGVEEVSFHPYYLRDVDHIDKDTNQFVYGFELTIQTMLKMFGFEIVHIGYEKNNDETGNLKDYYFYLKFNGEGIFNFNIKTTNNSRTLINKALIIDKTPPVIVEIVEDIEENYEEAQGALTPSEINRYYVKDEEATEGSGYYLDEFYYINENHYILNAYDIAELDPEPVGETRYIRAGGRYILDLLGNSVQKFVLRYDPVDEGQYGELKDLSISYFYEHAGEFKEDEIDQSIESPQRYVRRRIENQDIRLDFSLENVGTRFDTASAIEFGEDGREIRIEANVENTGTHTIVFRDIAGNITEYVGIIDAAAPKISLVRVNEQTQNISEYISRWSNDFNEVEVQIREENLDISSLKYYFGYAIGGTSEVRSVTEDDIEEIDGVYRFVISLSEFDNNYSGDLTLNLESSDMFYNSSSMSWTFKYDNIAPELKFAQGYVPPKFNIDDEVVGDFVTLRAEDYQNPPFFCKPGTVSEDNTTLLYNVQCFDEPGRETLNIEVFEHDTNNKFVFAGEYPVGVKVDLVAEDAAGNRSERLTTIIKINDSDAPYMKKPINGGSSIITNEEEVTITFNEIVMKYYCIFILDGNQEDCQGVESYAPAENIGYSKGNNTYYIRIDDGMDVSYIIDDGNIIVQGHYILNESNVFEPIDSGFGDYKLEQDYYLLKEEVIYFNLSPEGDYILSEDCSDTCYTLTTQKVEELLEDETYYYYIEETNTYKLVDEEHHPEDGIEYEYYQIIPEEIVLGTNEVYGKIGEDTEDTYGVFIVDDGSIVLPAHYTKENYARYGFNEEQREFTLTYNGDAHITYRIWVEDFAGNRSQNIEVIFDREAPKVDIEVDKVVIREAYSGNSYDKDNIKMSDNFDSLPHLNITGGFPHYYRYAGEHLPTIEIDDILNSFLNFAFILENHYVISYFKLSEELIGTAIEPGQNYYILQNGSFVKDNENMHVIEHHYIKGYELVDPSSVGNIKNPNIDYYFCNEEDVYVLDNTWKGAGNDYFATSWGIYIVAYRIQDRAGNFSEITKDSLRVVIYHDTNLPSLTVETVEKISNTLTRCEDGNCYVSFNVSDLRIIMNSDADIAGDENRIIKDEFDNRYDLLENRVILTSPEDLKDGENTIVITDKGYYVNRTTYFINGRIDKMVSGSGFVAYNEVECIDNSEESECNIANASFIRDYSKYYYYIVIKNYETGKLEPVSVIKVKDNGTLIMPGHRRDQTGHPLIEDSTLFATPKIRGTNYYIKDENQENIVDSDFRSFIWVENKTTFTFTVDNKAPKIEKSVAIIEDGDYHFEIIVDDISARVAYVKNGSIGDIIIQSGEIRADGSGVYAEIYDGKLRVVFTGDGSYSNVRAIDIAGNTSTVPDFVIDNTSPLENYNNVKNNAKGINFWYAVPSVRSGNNLNLYRNAPVFDRNKEYYPLFDEEGAILTNFNNEQFYAFQTYSKAHEYLLNLYFDQVNEQYYGVYSKQLNTTISLPNSETASIELAKWVYPVYTGDILYGDDLVKHGSTSGERVFLSDYVYCGQNIGNYCENQFNIPARVIIGNSPTITLTPEEGGLITMYYNGVSVGNRSGEFQLNKGEGIYIFQERDNAKIPNTGNNAYNYSYYAIIVKREMYSASGETPGFIQYNKETTSEKVIAGHYIKTGGTYVPVSDPVGSDKVPGVTYYLRNTRNLTYGEKYFDWRTNTDVYLNLPISMLDNQDLEQRISLSYLIVEVRSRTSGAASWTSRNILGADFFECVLEDTTTVCHPKPYLFEIGYNHIITISDRYGRELIFNVSLSETLPEIEITNLNYGFAKGVKITDSELTSMSNVELEFSEDINTINYESVEVLTIMTLRQFLNAIRNGSSGQLHVLEENTEALKGYYRIRIHDDHGNVSGWIEFTFNPVVVEMTLDFNTNFNHYMSGEHVITNQEVTIKWNDSENDLKIYRNGLLVNLPSSYPGKGTEGASISLDNPGLDFGEGNGIDGTYTFEIINRFDTGRVTNRIYHDALYALDSGDYILGEHYIANGDKYDPVPISDYGKEKDPSQTYYFLTKEGDYVIDNGSYVSRLHYVNTAGVYNRVDEQYISTEKAGHGKEFYIKRGFTSLEIDRINPSGYEINTHIIYPGVVDGRNVIDATKEYIYGDGRLGQIGERVTLVNKNVRVAWYTDEPGTSDIRYICYEVRLHGDVITSATCINNFKVIEEENYAYYDFLYTSQLAAGVDITFWLRDFAGNEKDVEQRSKFVLDVEITRATIYGRALTEIPENYITNQPHIILEILNEGAVYSSGHFYMPVQVGVPYLTGITYYTINSSGGYSPIPPQRPELTGEGNYVRLNIEYALIDVKTYTTIESGTYDVYIGRLAGIRDRISDNVELTFTITNPLMEEYRRIDNNASSHRHHVKQYSITIDIFAPEIRINRDNYVEVEGAFGGNLYRGALTIGLESGAKGFLCKLNYETDDCTNEIEFMEGYTIPNLASNSGKYSYYTRDVVGNESELYLFEIDNITPWFNFINQGDSLPVSEGGFTNASNIDISVSDNILNDKITLEYQLWSPGATAYGEWIGQSVNTYSFTQQGRYKVRIKDVAGNVSPVRSFIIDRSTPEVKFITSGDTGTREMYNGEIILNDQHPFSITWNDTVQTGNAAPITKVLVNGVLYKKGDLIPASIPTGEEEEEIIYRYGKTGEFDIVVTDLAGNISRYRKVIRNSNYICLNGQIVNVKAQYMFRGNNITFGIDKGFRFNSNDVVLFAMPMSSSNDTCSFTNYKMLDIRSFYEVRDDYTTINNSGESGMKYVLDSSYSSKIELNNSYVYAFVIEREVAEVDLQLPVDRFFFFEDPIGWSILFALGALILYSIIRVMFVRRKAKLL